MSSASLKFRLCFVVGLLLPLKATGCTFPSDLTGDWITSSRSTLTFTSTTFTPWTVPTRGTFTFTCLQNNGTIYISKSNSFTYIGLTWYAYLCMDLNAINSEAFYYNLGSTPETDAGNNKVKIFTDGTTITQDLVCDDTNYDTGTYDVMVKSGAAASAASSCATPVQAKWMYSFDTGSGDSCSSGSYLDVCTDTSMMTFNYSLCSTPVAYSASGNLYCIHSSTSGSNTYLSLYNADTTTDESTTYRFTCMVITTVGTTVYMTQYPQKCAVNQNSTVISSPGAALTLQNSTSCVPTTTTATTTTTTTAAEAVSSANALGIGLGVTFALLCVAVIVIFLIWYFWNKNSVFKEKSRGDGDVEDGPDTTRIEKMEKAEEVEKVEQTPVDVFDGSVPPDVLPRDTPTSPRENGRPATSGSIHVCLPSGDESERDDKSIELISEEIPNNMTSYSVVGVHPGTEDTDSGSDSPLKSFAPQKGIVPKGAVSLGNGTKPRSKVGKRNKLPPVEGKQLPPIVEDTTPRLNTPRGSISGLRRKLGGHKGTVGIQESTTESGSESLPGQPQPQAQTRSQSQRRGPVKLRQMRSQRVVKKPGQDKPERKVRTRSNRNNKDSSMDDEDGLLPSTPVRVTRVDIPTIKKDEPKKSPRNKRSDLKIVDMDGNAEKHVSSSDCRGMSPEPSYTPTSLHLRGYTPEVTTIAHSAPLRAPSPQRPMLRDGPESSRSPRFHRNDNGVRFGIERPQSGFSRSSSVTQSLPTQRMYSDNLLRPVSPGGMYGTHRSIHEVDERPRSRSSSRSRGRKRNKSLVRSQSEIRPSSAPAYAPRSIMLDVEELPPDRNNPGEQVLAARSLAVDMEPVNMDAFEQPAEKVGRKRGRDVRPKTKTRAKTAVPRSSSRTLSRTSSSADDSRSMRFWVFFAKPIILLTRRFQPSSFMRRREEAIADSRVEDWSLRSPRSPRRVSNVSSLNRRQPVRIEFGTADMSRIRELD